MWHKPCRTFNPWCLCIKTRCLFSVCMRSFCLCPPNWATHPYWFWPGVHPTGLITHMSNSDIPWPLNFLQATGLDVWASRVKCPARFVSHLHDICIYIWVVYSFCLFCCLFIIATWWYVWCIVWASGRVGVNSIPKLELQLNSNSNSGIGIQIEIGGIENGIEFLFLQLLPQHLPVNQKFPNVSFNRGHNLPCDWLLMQQCLSSWNIAPHVEGTLFPLSRQQSEGLKMVTMNISLPPWHKTKLLSLLNKIKWSISGIEVKLFQSTSFSLILLIGIFRSFMITHWYKCHRTLLINLIISPHCFG